MIRVNFDNNGNPEQEVWVFSDPHFGHKNICRGVTSWRNSGGEIPIEQTRDFAYTDEMDDKIIENINNCAKPDDILICLGDWSFGGFQNIPLFREELVCKTIHLILGNHDHHIERNRQNIRNIFTSVSNYETLEFGDCIFRLFHYPISSWDGVHKGHIHLHGHCHLPHRMKFGNGRKMDVGMDGHPEFRPYHLKNEIIPLLAERQISDDMNFNTGWN